MSRRWRRPSWVVGVASLAIVMAACSSSSNKSTSATSAAGGTSATSAGATGGAACSSPDTSIDAQEGQYAGWMQAVLNCTAKKPVKATGAPVTIGFINSQGDPNGSFPDVTAGGQATVDYINNELGGIGGDPLKGTPGRPIKLVTCYQTIAPSSSTSCANQVVSQKPVMIFSGYQFFGQVVDPIYAAAGIPVVNFSPITQADFQGKNIYDIAAGGGCVGVHPALISFSVYNLHAKNLAIPWANTPPGVPCYYDLEQKPVEVINGSLTPTPQGVKLVQGLKEKGYPVPPAAPDLSATAAQILAQKPDTIIFSGQASDCFNVMNALANAGWTSQQIPMVLSGACMDTKQIAQAGSKVDGVYFVGSSYNLLDPTSATGLPQQEIQTINTKMKQYQPSQTPTGLEAAMFQTIMTTWLTLQNSPAASDPTASAIGTALQNTSKVHMFAGVPWGCQSAPQNYSSVCSTQVSVLQWTGSKFKTVTKPFDASYIVAGTPLHETGSG
ncbi:MAG TPA: ABC transporter substrate-binding protein [Acidimicrobiales bacterium]|nr:ABC transporter substrate-binding protein [Acidimicrobiales bacterium]